MMEALSFFETLVPRRSSSFRCLQPFKFTRPLLSCLAAVNNGEVLGGNVQNVHRYFVIDKQFR